MGMICYLYYAQCWSGDRDDYWNEESGDETSIPFHSVLLLVGESCLAWKQMLEGIQ